MNWHGLKVYFQVTKSLYVGGYYRPHEGDTDSTRHLCDSLSRICNHTQSHVWLARDFNYPGIDWTGQTIKSECWHITRRSEFLDTLDATPLEQIIQEPTREGNTYRRAANPPKVPYLSSLMHPPPYTLGL